MIDTRQCPECCGRGELQGDDGLDYECEICSGAGTVENEDGLYDEQVVAEKMGSDSKLEHGLVDAPADFGIKNRNHEKLVQLCEELLTIEAGYAVGHAFAFLKDEETGDKFDTPTTCLSDEAEIWLNKRAELRDFLNSLK